MNPGHDLGALRRRISHTCLICGQVFTALVTARYCSNRCRQAAKYQRRTNTKKIAPSDF